MTPREVWQRVDIDYQALAVAMLADMKAQSRVYHARDDSIITRHLTWALSTVERRANINLHPATYRTVGYTVAAACFPCMCPLTRGIGYILPFNNVREMRLFDAADVDVTGDWEVVQREFGSNAEAYMVSPTVNGSPVGTAIELDVGVDDHAELDPAVVQAVQRFAASAYENREAILPLSDAGFDAELMQIWRPTA